MSERGEIKAKHILSAGTVLQAAENGDFLINRGRPARESVDTLIKEINAAKTTLLNVQSEDKKSDR